MQQSAFGSSAGSSDTLAFLGVGAQHFGTSTAKMKPHVEVGVTANLRRRKKKKKKEKLQIDESNSDVSDVLCCVMKMPHSRATGALALPLASARALLHQGKKKNLSISILIV